MTLTVTSPSFQEGQRIPDLFTCKGEDGSPELRIAGVPSGTKSLALVMEDPDAPRGTWTHWTAWDLPPLLTTILPGFQPATQGGVEGTTSAGTAGYHGPCPPPGKPHRYYFRVYALDGPLRLAAGAERSRLDEALRGRLLAQGSLMGTYSR